MKRFARVENNTAREILVAEELPPFHPDIAAQFQEVGESVQEGWQLVDGTFQPPPPIEPPPVDINAELEKLFYQLLPKHLDPDGTPKAYLTDDVIEDVIALKDKVTTAFIEMQKGLPPMLAEAPLRNAVTRLPIEMEADAQDLLNLARQLISEVSPNV